MVKQMTFEISEYIAFLFLLACESSCMVKQITIEISEYIATCLRKQLYGKTNDN